MLQLFLFLNVYFLPIEFVSITTRGLAVPGAGQSIVLFSRTDGSQSRVFGFKPARSQVGLLKYTQMKICSALMKFNDELNTALAGYETLVFPVPLNLV